MRLEVGTQFVALSVTEPVLKEVRLGNDYQRQIAIKDASPELLATLAKANAQTPISLSVGGTFSFIAHDTRAIWLTHQTPGTQAEDFAALFNLLARRPGVPIRFVAA